MVLSLSAKSPVAAFFDVDGTLVQSNIVNYYVYFRRRRMSAMLGRLWFAVYLLKCVYYLIVDRIDRCRFNIAFYKDYAGLPASEIEALAEDCFDKIIEPRMFEQARPCIREHQGLGHRTLLVTGSVNFIIRPLAASLGMDDVLAPGLVVRDGRFSGALDRPPLCDGEKVRHVLEFARKEGIDLSQSHAYGDSIADLAMLETVGFPHAVNPDSSLAAVARKKGWPIHAWTRQGPSRGIRA